MFTFMQSATAKLASKLAPHSSLPTGVVLEGPRQLYDREFYKELVMHLYAVKAQNRTVFGRVRNAGLDVLGKAKNLWFKSMPLCPAPVVTAPENFDIPHIFVTEETRSPVNPIRRRARVQVHRNACTNVPFGTHTSMTLEGSNHLEAAADDDRYQDPYDILEESGYEWEPGNSEYYAMVVTEEEADDTLSDPETESDSASSNEPEVGDDDDISEPSILEAHCGDGPSYFSAGRASSPWTTPSPTSVFFCPPTPVPTLGTSTSFGEESGPSTPHLTPVLMHESASYEDALFSEFSAITRVGIYDDGVLRDGSKDVLALHRM